VDTSHTSLGGFLFEILERFAARIVHVQASDNRGVSDDHLAPGAGILDWPRIVTTLERIDFRGVLMLEVAGNGDIARHVGEVAAAARRVLVSPRVARGSPEACAEIGSERKAGMAASWAFWVGGALARFLQPCLHGVTIPASALKEEVDRPCIEVGSGSAAPTTRRFQIHRAALWLIYSLRPAPSPAGRPGVLRSRRGAVCPTCLQVERASSSGG
jgi:hypothetical protein